MERPKVSHRDRLEPISTHPFDSIVETTDIMLALAFG
jgi:hypothetical protein